MAPVPLLSFSVLTDVVVVLRSLSMTAQFLISLGLLQLLTLAKTANKVADFMAPFMKNVASKMQLMYLVSW